MTDTFPSSTARSSTKGPLDLDEYGISVPYSQHSHSHSSPLASDCLQSTSDDPLTGNAPNPLAQTTPSSLRKAQVAPDSPLISSSISFSPQRTKDLSFLLHPSIYHTLPLALHQDRPDPSPQTVTIESIPSLLKSQNYRAAADFCARHLCHAPAPSQNEILYLFYIRLASLTLLNYTSLAAQESKALEDISGPFYRSDLGVTKAADVATPEEFGSGEAGSILPWELQVLWARLTGVAHGDVRKGITTYYELAQHARRAYKTCKAGDSEQKDLWRSRLRDLGLGVASILAEAGDLDGAARHLDGLRVSEAKATRTKPLQSTSSIGRDANGSALLASRTALVQLALGDVDAATKCLETTPSDSSAPSPTDPSAMLPSMIAIVEGRYADAADQLRALLKSSGSHHSSSSTTIILHNLAVCLFYTGHVDQTIRILESLIDGSSSGQPLHLSSILSSSDHETRGDEEKAVNASDDNSAAAAAAGIDDEASSSALQARSFHALTFNLATCFEITSERAAAKKAELAERVMDRLRESGSRAERSGGADFKL